MDKILPVVGAWLALTISSTPVVAETELEALKKRVNELEQKQQTSSKRNWPSHITLNGSAEVEADYSDTDIKNNWSDQSSSDIRMQEAELNFGFTVSNSIVFEAAMKYEKDDDDFNLEQAKVIMTHLGDTGLNLEWGKVKIPYGTFNSHMASKPLIQALTETQEHTAVLSMEQSNLSAAVYAFNGDIDEDDDNKVQNFGFRVVYQAKPFKFGVDYNSNAMDSNMVSEELGVNSVTEAAGAFLIYGEATLGNATVIGEYYQADEFEDFGNIEPEAIQLEVAIPLSADWTAALTYQETDDAALFNLPEERISLSAATPLRNNANLTIELFRDQDYSISDGGTGENANTILVELEVHY